MHERIAIDSDDSLTRFLRIVDWLHDSVVREVAFRGHSYVHSDGRLSAHGEPADISVIFHSQNRASPVVQLDCQGVLTLRWSQTLDLSLEAEIQKSKIVMYLSGREFADEMLIETRSASYRLLGPEHLGEISRITRDDAILRD